VTKLKLPIFLMGLLLVLSACNASAASSNQSTELPPTPFADTPAPAQINAALIENPSLVKIRFLNELDGWGVTETQIVRTNDGGITWYNVTPSDVTETGYSIGIFVLNNEHVWLQKTDPNPNRGLLYRTLDGGITWTSFDVPFGFADINFLDADNGWALASLGAGAGSEGVAVFQTTDGGATWDQTYTNDPNLPNAADSLPLGGIKNGLTPLNMQTAWVSGVTYSSGSVYLFRTDDGGANWAQVTSVPLPANAQNAQMGVEHLEFVTPSDAFMTVFMAAEDTRTAVYISNDSGDTFSLTPTLIPNGGSTDFLSATEAVIYNGEQFYVTRDAARTWSIIPPDIIFGDTFAMMDFVNTLTGWVITVDPTTNQRTLYRTNDGGATWSPVIP
jgi:photosystem II stability/assembly factor-like uncharacterized protein